MVYDAMRNTAYLINAPVNVIAAGEEIFAYSDNYEYKLAEGGRYTFTSGEIDFSSRKVKVLKELVLKGASDVEIEVSNGVSWRIVRGVRGKFRPNVRGKSFKIRVKGKDGINGIYAVAEVTDAV